MRAVLVLKSKVLALNLHEVVGVENGLIQSTPIESKSQ